MFIIFCHCKPVDNRPHIIVPAIPTIISISTTNAAASVYLQRNILAIYGHKVLLVFIIVNIVKKEQYVFLEKALVDPIFPRAKRHMTKASR